MQTKKLNNIMKEVITSARVEAKQRKKLMEEVKKGKRNLVLINYSNSILSYPKDDPMIMSYGHPKSKDYTRELSEKDSLKLAEVIIEVQKVNKKLRNLKNKLWKKNENQK